jgi:hypothetical protein
MLKPILALLALAAFATLVPAASAHVEACTDATGCLDSPVDTDPAHACVGVLYNGQLVQEQVSVSDQECSI